MKKYILLFLVLSFLSLPCFAFAAVDKIEYQVNIGAPETISNRSIGDYIGTVYQIAMGVVGVLAVVVMMFGGIMWMMAGGSPERIQSAKGWIFGAMSGLVLAFSSYTILNIINPNLVKFKAINGIKNPEYIPKTNNDAISEYLGTCECPLGTTIGLVNSGDVAAGKSGCVFSCGADGINSEQSHLCPNDKNLYCCVCNIQLVPSH